jgi:glutathione S-transferase
VYAEKSEAEKDNAKHIFNCAQRAHQNTLGNHKKIA